MSNRLNKRRKQAARISDDFNPVDENEALRRNVLAQQKLLSKYRNSEAESRQIEADLQSRLRRLHQRLAEAVDAQKMEFRRGWCYGAISGLIVCVAVAAVLAP